MRLTSTVRNEAEKGEKKDFSRAKTLLEGIKRHAAIAAAALAIGIAPMSCGGDPGPTDGGSGGDGGVMTDGGHDSGGDGGGSSLCALYPDGSPNRVTFTATAAGNVQNPGDNSINLRVFMRQIKDNGDGYFVTLGFYNTDSPSTPPEYIGIHELETRTKNVVNFGDITMQACSITHVTCTLSSPNGSVTGDPSCSAVVAADRPWGAP